MTIRRGTANILDKLPPATARHRLRVLVARCDVLALQEWPGNRNAMLRALPGWTFQRPRAGGGPIGVRDSLGEKVLSCRAKILTGPGFVGKSPGRKSRAVLGPSFATRLKSRRPDGTIVVRYNIHLTAGVQAGKRGYRTDSPARRRVQRHRRERHKIERLVSRDIKRGHDVEVFGDTNYHHMLIRPLTGWWVIAPDAPTFGARTIDGIWTRRKPSTVDFLPPVVRGEHRHVITS